MGWELIIAPIAGKRLAKIPQPERRRILLAINRLHDGPTGDIKPLKGREEWRLRVGGWRIIFSINAADRIIYIKYIDVRGDVYKN
ncbi:MAG: type II toxin-antitoxin system RelE/ParE family toxin [Fretibacterium sp.]|nr:type II toxin-antitoxin system RelE/ParE family toxin [Fretibacterium sp.]